MSAEFEIAAANRKITALVADASKLLSASEDPDVRALASELRVDTEEAARIRVAFVGQYDAGKSTILSALTGRRDLRIGADVTTDVVTSFVWEGVDVQDTPGIHAGRPDHDAITYAAIARSDLLVFVISNELFDDRIADHFRQLAFDRAKAQEMILVVNKMSQDSGDAATKLPDVARVIDPLSPGDLRTTFIDARCRLEAEETSDPEERRELDELSNFDAFVGQLNSFVRERGFLGRLANPVHRVLTAANQALRLTSVDSEDERAALELLHRKKSVLLQSRAQLRSRVERALDTARADIIAIGDEVAEQIDPGTTQEALEEANKDAQRKAERRSETLLDELRSIATEELTRLDQELAALAASDLAKRLVMSSTSLLERDEGVRAQIGAPDFDGQRDFSPTAKVANVAKTIGDMAVKAATGPAGTVTNAGSSMASAGSNLHKAVYGVGKFFGVNFKPWGAVNAAKFIGNAGRVIGAIGGIVTVVLTFVEEAEERRVTAALKKARNDLRREYRSVADAITEELRRHMSVFSEATFAETIADTEKQAADLVGNRRSRAKSATAFVEIEARARELLESSPPFPARRRVQHDISGQP